MHVDRRKIVEVAGATSFALLTKTSISDAAVAAMPDHPSALDKAATGTAVGRTAHLSDWLSRLSMAAIPAATMENAKTLILDGLGCAIVGAQLPWSRTATEAVSAFDGQGDAMLIGHGKTVSRSAAVLLNSTYIQAFELDDVHVKAPLHSASLVLPALFAASTDLSTTGRDFLLAAIAGFEVGPRVGMALHGAEMLSRGWHSGAVFGTHAAAAAAAVLMKLSASQIEDALGMAGTQSGGLMAAQFGAMCKRMQHGFAARSGYTAAMLARGGVTGIKQIYEQPYGGFLAVFGEGHSPVPDAITRDLGSVWETGQISMKRYAAMGACHGPLDALFTIRERRPFRAEEIARVDVALSQPHYSHGWWDLKRPTDPVSAQMHVGYALAVGILDNAALVDQYAPTRINRDDLWRVLPRVHARHEPSFDANAVATLQSETTISFVDGSIERQHIDLARSFTSPLTRPEAITKFHHLAGRVMPASRREMIQTLILNIDRLESIRPIREALAPLVGSAFA